MKDHIADIEINAHRRTEELRASIMAEIREIIQYQRNWCTHQKGTYDDMNASLLQALRHAESSVASVDTSALDDMLVGLQQLEDNLQK